MEGTAPGVQSPQKAVARLTAARAIARVFRPPNIAAYGAAGRTVCEIDGVRPSPLITSFTP